MISLILVMLMAGFTIGLMLGLWILAADRRRARSTRSIVVKNQIRLDYDCTRPGIYDALRDFFGDK